MLTQKQEQFAQHVAAGMRQAEAYRAAYSAEKMKPETIWSRVSELMADSKVAGRVDELREALTKKGLWTREKSVKALATAYKVASDQSNASGMVAAVKELNLMHGFNAPQKHELTGADGKPIETQSRVMVYLPDNGRANGG